MEAEVTRHYVEATIVGTAIAPRRGRSNAPATFVSDLSVSEFVLLRQAGWQTVGLVFGASFVFVHRRSPVKVAGQARDNVELTNFTDALYASRAAAMERMQAQALELKAAGVVGVRLSEGPLEFAHHAVRFAAIGTAIRPVDAHIGRLQPALAVSVNDPGRTAPELLRGRLPVYRPGMALRAAVAEGGV